MTGVTQKIPNYIGGISQQPDELMPPGSVRDAVNVLPDVTDGLTKRSGSRLVNPLVTDTPKGKWFHINRDKNEKYIGKINHDGTVEMFNCANGLPVPVLYRDLPEVCYLRYRQTPAILTVVGSVSTKLCSTCLLLKQQRVRRRLS